MSALFDPSLVSVRSITWLALLLDASVKGLIVIAAAGVLCLALRRASAASRHLIWSLAMVSLIGLPFLSALLPRLQVPILPRPVPIVSPEPGPLYAGRLGVPPDGRELPLGSETADETPALPEALRYAEPPSVEIGNESEISPEPSIKTKIREHVSEYWPAWILSVWALGAVAALAPLLVGMGGVWRRGRHAKPITEGLCATLMSELNEKLGLRSRVRLLESDDALMPTTWGVLHPDVLLPSEAQHWPEEKCRIVLLHELAHIRRRDWLAQTVARIACSLHWFIPLAWLAARRLRVESEQACDDSVLRAGYKASGYADQLLEIVRSMARSRCASLATVPIARSSKIERRVAALLDATRNRHALTHLSIILALVAVTCTVLPLAALRPTTRTAAADEVAVSPKLPSAAERKKMLKRTGLALKMYAAENSGRFPLKVRRSGVFQPEMDNLQKSLDQTGAGAELFAYLTGQRGVQLCYLGYVVTDEKVGLALLEELSGRTEADLPQDVYVSRPDGGYDTIYMLREGIERTLIKDPDAVDDPEACAIAQSTIPILWEIPDDRDRNGGWVLYMDGHVERKPYPGEFPMTERFITRLREMMGLSASQETLSGDDATGPARAETATAEPEQGAEIVARPLTPADRELSDELVQFARIADRRFSDTGDYRFRAALYHVRSDNEATVWEILHLGRGRETEREQVDWGSSRRIDAEAEYYLPDGTPLKSRWEPRSGGMHDIYIDVGRPVAERERVPVVSRQHNAPDQFLVIPGTGERRFEFWAWTNNPGAWIVRLDKPLERGSFSPGGCDIWDEDDYTELTWLLPPDPDSARGYVNFTVPAGSVGSELLDRPAAGVTGSTQRETYGRALSAELGRTISTLDDVRSARVSVTLPEKALFADEQEEPRASVLVEVREAGALSRQQVDAIVHLVAAGVEGLKERNITIVDTKGNVLAGPAGSDAEAEDLPTDISRRGQGAATMTIGDLKAPFTFKIHTLSPKGKPQPGVNIRCLHPREERGKALVDVVVASDESGIAEFRVMQSDLVLDRYFWFSRADDLFVGTPSGVGISPLDNEYEYTFRVMPTEQFALRVVNEEGEPIPDAEVRLTGEGASRTARSDAQGMAVVRFADVRTDIKCQGRRVRHGAARGSASP